ncbi:MAG: SIR2 family NAD-dependent protein deacylase [Sulfuricella sp.]
MTSISSDCSFTRCADLIQQADSLLITAGAGMGVDSGLPDFRGEEGFWQAYPALAKARVQFHEIANPAAFRANPRLAWGFYGHRLNLYRQTIPHEGFSILRRIGETMPHGMFVFTSNVDGQFQKARFSSRQVHECHGSIHHLQCQDGCMADIWPADDFHPQVDKENCLLTSDFPRCPHCGEIARPNILMFSDGGWLDYRSELQEANLKVWLGRIQRPVIIEIGAGHSIPTVRRFGENQNGFLIRINPTEPERHGTTYTGFKLGGLAALRGIEGAMTGTGRNDE